MSGTQSFNRLAILQVFGRSEDKGSNGISTLQATDIVGTTFPSRFGDNSPGFRISFTVEKPVGPVPFGNPATIKIWNINEDSRHKFEKLFNVVVLRAGYGDSADVLFSGQISRCVTRKEGPDYVTEISAADGYFAMQNAVINSSFGKGTSFTQLFESLFANLKGAGVEKGVIEGIPNKNINSGICLTGSTTEQMAQLCEQNDLNFKIENGKAQIIPYGKSVGNSPYYLSPDTGLIGIPEIKEQGYGLGIADPAEKNKKPLNISFKCLLNPKIISLSNVYIDSKFVKGLFITTKVTYEGDSWDGPWFTTAEAFQPADFAKAQAAT